MSVAQDIISQLRAENRLELTDYETKQILSCYDFPLPREKLTSSAQQAAEFAAEIGGPVVLKLISPAAIHKSDIGGVKIGVQGRQEVQDAFAEIMGRAVNIPVQGVLVQEYIGQGSELILGVASDPTFGRVIMFGLGGIFVELLEDVAFRVVPLSRQDARQIVEETRAYTLLRGLRGRPAVDVEAVVELIVKLSRLADELRADLAELDINPLFAVGGSNLLAVDTRAALTAKRNGAEKA
jgi:acyl-CoA synthetase (NDP forming)